MKVDSFEIRLCQNPDCGLRYPLVPDHPFGERCPVCLGDTQGALKRKIQPLPVRESKTEMKDREISALLDNIRSAWNVGSIFRSANGLGVGKLYLCGLTPSPENKAVAKTSLGAEESTVWEYSRNALEKAKKLKREGFLLIALEQDAHAVPLTEFQLPNHDSHLSVLILGNEITGVDPDILDICDHILHIPMRGCIRSFNVEVAFAIAAYHLVHILAKAYLETEP